MDSEAPSSTSHARVLGRRACRHVRLLPAARNWTKGAATGLVSFGVLGTVAALWENPFFVRMTAAGGWEISLLALLSTLIGAYVTVRRSTCGARRASAGGLIGFLGIACPVCNKILLLLFGGDLLLTYFEPIRIYVAAGGSLLVSAAILAEWRRRPRSAQPLSEGLRPYG